jgi:iron complex outermembrane recepter protein
MGGFSDRIHCASAAFIVAMAAALLCYGARAESLFHFDLPAQPLARSLKAIGAATNTDIGFSANQVAGLQAPAIKADLTVDGALMRALAGTGLRPQNVGDHSILIVPEKSGDQSSDEGPGANPKSKSADDQLGEVVVTGSRLFQQGGGPQETKVYASEQIEQSGETTVTGFLNTLPSVSIPMDSSGVQSVGSSVRLHGLPLGTTLVLIDGLRVAEPGGLSTYGNIFDLNNIPVTAVERIEVVEQGSSAVYGSDAIAGVVNIILKKNFSGFAADASYGKASDTDNSTLNLAWGNQWDKGSLSAFGSYMATSQLLGSDRALTANQDYTAYGSTDQRFDYGNPGNVFSLNGSNLPGIGAPYAAVPAGFNGTPTIGEFAATAGTLNKTSYLTDYGLIPHSTQEAILVSGHYDFTPAVELFGQLLFSKRFTYQDIGVSGLYAQPGYSAFTVSASNPFNPFGETVGVGYTFADRPQYGAMTTMFWQPTLGVRGNLFEHWYWEFSGWWSDQVSELLVGNQPNNTLVQNALNSSDPATALNPFVAGAGGSPQLLQSLLYTDRQDFHTTRLGSDAIVRGPLVELPSGPIAVVLGAEFVGDRLSSADAGPGQPSPLGTAQPVNERHSSAGFAEAQIPILPKRDNGQDVLTVNLAGRYDRYSDIGSKTTPQFGIQWRPLASLLVHGSWGKAFKAPSLFELYQAQSSNLGTVFDPLTGKTEIADLIEGGSTRLKPETGTSRSFGLEYGSSATPGLHIGVSWWSITENNSIQIVNFDTIAAYPNDFPGAVTRASSCAGGPPCPIVAVQFGYVNFGTIEAKGFDYDIGYRVQSALGEWSPSIALAQIYRYDVALIPGAPPIESAGAANDDGNWAPKWKGTIALGWSRGPFKANVAGRYTGIYRDYDPLSNGTYQMLGNFWLTDINLRLDLGRALNLSANWLTKSYLELGAVNVFDTKPQFSTYGGGFEGVDFFQADLRGRFVYAKFGVKL